MALWDNIFKGRGVERFEQKTLSPNDYQLDSILHQALYAYYGKDMPLWSADKWEQYVTDGYLKNSDVYAIVSYILHAMTRVKFKIKVETRGGNLEDADESELAGLFQQYVTSDFKQAAQGYKLLTGNSYLYGMRPDSGRNVGKIQELDVLPSQYTEILFGEIGDPIGGYHLKIGDTTKRFEADDICHIKYWNPDAYSSSHMYGLSPIKAAAMLVQQSTSAQRSNASAMEHQGPPVLLSRDNDQLTPDQASELSNEIAQRYGGSVNRHKRIPITGGSLKAIQLGLSPADLKIIESQKVTFEKLCQVYRFPVTILDSKSATLDNMKVAERLLYTNCVIPEFEVLRDKLQRWLVPAYGNEFRITIDTSDIEALQDDKAEMVDWLSKAWWIKASRKQELMGEEADPAMDSYFVPAGLSAVRDISELENQTDEAKRLEQGLYIYGQNNRE